MKMTKEDFSSAFDALQQLMKREDQSHHAVATAAALAIIARVLFDISEILKENGKIDNPGDFQA